MNTFGPRPVAGFGRPDPGSETWATDILTKTSITSPPHEFIRGLVFVPAKNMRRGKRERPMGGARKMVNINTVRDDWRDRDRLARPDRPVR